MLVIAILRYRNAVEKKLFKFMQNAQFKLKYVDNDVRNTHEYAKRQFIFRSGIKVKDSTRLNLSKINALYLHILRNNK